MDYKDIDRVNSEISMIDLKGKNYAMVPERVTAFRKLFPDGFITTEILSNDGTTVLMKATAGYYRDGVPVVLGSGMAQEIRGKGMVNGTSHIENCETSAVGRALGMIGLGINGGGICSAEELVNAITAQNQMKQEKKEPLPEIKQEQTATVSTAAAVPAPSPKKQTEAQKLIATMKRTLEEDFPGYDFKAERAKLIEENLIDGKPSSQMTLEEASMMIDLLYQRAKGCKAS